ncbi:MAG: DUF2860 family protein, partial [Vibrio sp.]
TSRADIGIGNFLFEAGYAYELAPRSSIAISYLPDFIQNETFENPFLTEQSRKKTDTSGHAIRFKYNGILSSAWSLDLAYYTHDVDDETSGEGLVSSQDMRKLEREGSGFYSKLSYFMPLSRELRLVPALIYQNYDADGDAMSHQALAAEASLIQQVERHTFAFTAAYQYTDFDEANPVFDKTQHHSKYKAFLAYEYNKLMGWDNWAFSMLAGYNQTSANIDFYDQTQFIFGSGVSYKF